MAKTLLVSLLFAFLVFSVISGQAAAQQDPYLGLVSYWPFNEGSGENSTNVVTEFGDILGRKGDADAVDSGSINWTGGMFGSGIVHEAIVNPLDSMKPRDGITISAWVMMNSTSGRWMMVNNHFSHRLEINYRKPSFQLNLDDAWAQNWLYSSTKLDPGRWYHIAGTYDGSYRRIYIDGILDSEEAITGKISEGNDYFLNTDSAGGIVDEIKIWNRALSLSEIQEIMDQGESVVRSQLDALDRLYFYPNRVVGMLGESGQFSLKVYNSDPASSYSGNLNVRVISPGGSDVYDNSLGIFANPMGRSNIEFSFTPTEAGYHEVEVLIDGIVIYTTRIYVMSPVPRKGVSQLDKTLLQTIDLTQSLGPDMLWEDPSNPSQVVNSPIGSYREAGTEKHSRFAVNIQLPSLGLYLIRVTYPDDKPRSAEIALNSENGWERRQVQSGYFTGNEYRISDSMKTVDYLVWPSNTTLSLIFTTWRNGWPAAASQVEVYEIHNGLPASDASLGLSNRNIGLYWEDAKILFNAFGGTDKDLENFDSMAQNLCDYMDYTGQNVLYYPIVWYDGPIYNSFFEERYGNRGGDSFPLETGWIDILLKRFEERGFAFVAMMNVHKLSTLEKQIETDQSILTVTKDDTMPPYSTRKGLTYHHLPPAFNALHPDVQKPIKDLVSEITARFSHSPAFDGIGLHLTQCQMTWASNLDASYDDWTIQEFKDDNPGITSGFDPSGTMSGSQRYAWLMANARDEWIDWRIDRVRDYFAQLTGIIRDEKPDLRFVVSIWDPMPMVAYEDWDQGKTYLEMTRDYSIDPDTLAGIEGLQIHKLLGNTDYRKKLSSRQNDDPSLYQSIRDMNFAAEQLQVYNSTKEFGVYLHNRYFESDVGEFTAENSPWFSPIRWRASGIVPQEDYFMELYANSLDIFDMDEILIGGLTTGTVGHEEKVRRFASVFRALPEGKWSDMDTTGNDARARVVIKDGVKYLYIVNLEPDGGIVSLSISDLNDDVFTPMGESGDLAINGNDYEATLEPFGLWGGSASIYVNDADISRNGCVEIEELIKYIENWHGDSTTYPMSELVEATGFWHKRVNCF